MNEGRGCEARLLRFIVGEPGTGKSVVNHALCQRDPKRLTPVVNRTLHTYHSTLRARSTFTDDALSLIVRPSEGVLRRARNLCLSALLEAVRDESRATSTRPATLGRAVGRNALVPFADVPAGASARRAVRTARPEQALVQRLHIPRPPLDREGLDHLPATR